MSEFDRICLIGLSLDRARPLHRWLSSSAKAWGCITSASRRAVDARRGSSMTDWPRADMAFTGDCGEDAGEIARELESVWQESDSDRGRWAAWMGAIPEIVRGDPDLLEPLPLEPEDADHLTALSRRLVDRDLWLWLTSEIGVGDSEWDVRTVREFGLDPIREFREVLERRAFLRWRSGASQMLDQHGIRALEGWASRQRGRQGHWRGIVPLR